MHAAGGPNQVRGSDTVDATVQARPPEVPDEQASDTALTPEQTPPVRHQRGARFPSAARRRRWSAPEQQPEAATGAEERATEEQATEERATEERVTEERVTEEQVSGQPSSEQAAVGQPSSEQAAAEQPSSEQPAVEHPAVDELVADERAAVADTRPSPRVRTVGAAEVAVVAPVRPYVLTRGRTRASHEFALETLVSSSQDPARLSMVEGEEHRAVLVLCVRPRSVVEVAAMLGVPLGVARVLLGDLTDIGAVTVHRSVGPGGPDLALMSRVLEGLRRL